MNQIGQRRIEALKDAYGAGLSVRAASAQCGICRGTVERHFNRWKSEDFGGEVACQVKGETKRALKAEASKRDTSMHALLSNIIEAIAEDNMFAAILD